MYKGFHPTQKPIALVEFMIKTYTNEGDLVFDPTFGSGTTMVAAKQLNRNAMGCELEDKYFKICKERVDNAIVGSSLTNSSENIETGNSGSDLLF